MNAAFIIQRRTLTNGTSTEIAPPYPARSVEVINLTGAALRVYTTAGDSTAYLEIADGWGREFDFGFHRFQPDQTAFHLLSAATGTVVLEWK